jgi:hypothetical protein
MRPLCVLPKIAKVSSRDTVKALLFQATPLVEPAELADFLIGMLVIRSMPIMLASVKVNVEVSTNEKWYRID